MSQWSYENEHGDRIVIRDGDADGVSVIATTPLRPEDAVEDEAAAVFNLPPDVARDMAQWLVIYADASEHALREPPESSAIAPGSWWDGPPSVPENPTSADIRKAYQILVCTSPRNVTELGWFPATMNVDEALKVTLAWHTWSSEVSKRYKENEKD
jgi:hypothetical protein